MVDVELEATDEREHGQNYTPEINIITSSRRVITLRFDSGSNKLSVDFDGKRPREQYETSVHARQILWTQCDGGHFELSLISKKDAQSWELVQYVGRPEADNRSKVEGWCSVIMAAAYKGIKISRKLRVLVNPRGGPGKALSIYLRVVEPILKAARCTYDTTYTTHRNHAQEIAKETPLDYDAMVLLSGDGLAHEVINGYNEHENPLGAFAIPIAPIPTGSGNALSVNLMGPGDGFDVTFATLNAIKGLPMKADACSFTQGNTHVLSFLTQALGLMAELDYDTENLRWMGDTRFIIGYLYGVMRRKPCPIKLSIKAVEQDKQSLANNFRAKKDNTPSEISNDDAQVEEEQNRNPFLELNEASSQGDSEEGWITIDKPLVYVYAGKGPYVGRDLMQFPVSNPSDGFIDIAVQAMTGRKTLLMGTFGADKGGTYWVDSQFYYKATAYRVEPLYSKNPSSNYVMIDGEHFPLEPFEVQVRRGLVTFLSPTGRYASDFEFGKDREADAEKKRIVKVAKLRGKQGAHGLKSMCCIG